MSELVLPPWIIPESEPHEWLDDGSSVFRGAFAPGLAQRQSYGGMRLKLSRRHTVRLEEKAQLLSILSMTRGQYNAIRTKVHFAFRGSFSSSQVLSNNTFASGTTGWASGSAFTLSVADRILMSKVGDGSFASTTALYPSSGVTLTQYAPYVARAIINAGRGSLAVALEAGTSNTSGAYTSGTSSSAGGTQTIAFVPYQAASYINIDPGVSASNLAGDYVSIPYLSLSRCALVDAGNNSLLLSDDLGNGSQWSTTGLSTVTENIVTSPDGTATSESLVENSSASEHYIQQTRTGFSSSAADYAFAIALKGGSRTWGILTMVEGTASTSAQAWFNLSTGATGSTNTGANWSNVRTFISSLGNDWYYCCIVGRKTNAATSLSVRVQVASANSTASYTGNGSGNIYAWRATLSQSSVPSRLVLTTVSAVTGTPTGSAVHVKGLEASASGLILPGDWFEIGGEIKQATAALNSDAAGLGYLQFEPALVRSPANNDPIVITDPMGKFLVSNVKVDNDFGTQARVSYDLEHIYE